MSSARRGATDAAATIAIVIVEMVVVANGARIRVTGAARVSAAKAAAKAVKVALKASVANLGKASLRRPRNLGARSVATATVPARRASRKSRANRANHASRAMQASS